MVTNRTAPVPPYVEMTAGPRFRALMRDYDRKSICSGSTRLAMSLRRKVAR